MKIPDINKIRKGVQLTSSINSAWHSMAKVDKGSLLFNGFELIFDGVWMPGYTKHFLDQAEKQNRFDESANLSNEYQKYAEGFTEGYNRYNSDHNNFIKESVAGIIKHFNLFEEPVHVVKTSEVENKLLAHDWNGYGERVGRFYCAWCIIIENQTAFEPLFFVTKSVKTKKSHDHYTDRQIAIAYFILGTPISEENYKDALAKYSKNEIKSKKILQKSIRKSNQIKPLNENKKGYTEHLEDLKKAKQLLSGTKNKNAVNNIESIITAFNTTYDLKY